MKKAIIVFLAGFMFITYGISGELKKISDEELSEISAQGFNMNFQTLDNAFNTSNVFQNFTFNDPSLKSGETVNINHLNLVDSMFISGQQNAFVPINAVDSAVNVPINIVFVMNSKISGGINITNSLNAALNPLD